MKPQRLTDKYGSLRLYQFLSVLSCDLIFNFIVSIFLTVIFPRAARAAAREIAAAAKLAERAFAGARSV
jgi:hypothetical protein